MLPCVQALHHFLQEHRAQRQYPLAVNHSDHFPHLKFGSRDFLVCPHFHTQISEPFYMSHIYLITIHPQCLVVSHRTLTFLRLHRRYRHHYTTSSQPTLNPTTMCEYEQFSYVCGCEPIRRSSYCHSARCDDAHQCFSVKVLKRVWKQAGVCPDCAARARSMGQQHPQQTIYSPRG